MSNEKLSNEALNPPLRKGDVSGWRYFSSQYPKWNSNLEIVWADGTEDIFNWTKPNAEQIDFDIDCKPIKWRYACG